MAVDDYFRLKEVSDPQVSADTKMGGLCGEDGEIERG